MRIIIACHKGGTGKTATAAHLCFHLARQGEEVCAWDTDLQANLLSWLTEHQWDGQENLRISDEGQADIIATTQKDTALRHDPLIIDTPPEIGTIDDLRSEMHLQEDDLVVCPTNGRLAVEGALTIAEKVAEVGCRVLFVANKTDPKKEVVREEIEGLKEATTIGALNVELFELGIPSNIEYMREAEKKGVPIWDLDYANRTHTGKALRALCEWIAQGAPPDNNPPMGNGSERQGTLDKDLKDRLWK